MSDAIEGEAIGVDTVSVEWLGHNIDLPASTEEWDLDVLRAFRSGDVVGVLEGLIGADAFARIEKAHRAANGGRFLARDLKPLGDKIAELYGFEGLGK